MRKVAFFMEEAQTNSSRPVNPRRKKPTPMQIFKERFLPLIIVALTLILIIVFIVGSITRAVQRNKIAKDAAEALLAEENRISQEAEDIATEAALLADRYDYPAAIALIDSFSGDLNQYPELTTMRNQYVTAESQLITWDDPNSVLNLSFHMLIADPARAFGHEEEGGTCEYHYITIDEFNRALDQLYANDYILVSLDDFVTKQTNENGDEVLVSTSLRLPAGKKPLIITQTNVNYDLFLVDSNGDMIADKDGCGYASKLVLDASGKVVCEYIDADGQTLTGAYDLIPILDAFVENHPDFSYRGAKAIIALSGHEGLFGYRTGTEFENHFGTAVHDEEVAAAKAVATALIRSGYDLACYTYENVAYGSMTQEQIQQDQTNWLQQVEPIIGHTDTLVYAKTSDITDAAEYSGGIYDFLKQAGYWKFIGQCTNGTPWATVNPAYLRQGRIMVTGNNLINNPSWFENILDPATVLDMATREKY